MAEYLSQQSGDKVGEYLNYLDILARQQDLEEEVIVRDVDVDIDVDADADADTDDVDSMSPPPLAYTKLWKLLRSLKHTRRRRRQKHLPHDSDDISGAGRKNYGPLNESAPGWDRATIDHLMSNDVPQQELAQADVPAPDMTKDYVDRYFGFLPPKLLHNIINHEKSRRRQRIDTYFRSEHGCLPPRISKVLYGSFNPPQYARKVLTTAAAAAAAVPSASPAGPPMAAPLHPAVSPATSSVGSSLDELVRDLLNQENVQQQEIKSAENVMNEMDTFIQVLNSGMRDLKDHLSTAAATPVAHQQQQDTTTTMLDDKYLRSLMDDFPDFGEAPPSALAPTPPHVSPAAVRYTAMKKLGAPPSSPPPFDSEDDDDGTAMSSSPPLPLSQHIARKSMPNLVAAPSDTDSSSSSSISRHKQYLQQAPVSEVHRLLRRVFREQATGQRNNRNATHKIFDIAHNIAKEHIH